MEPGFGITYRYDKTTNSGGILATVKIGLWTLIGNKNTRLILGVIYICTKRKYYSEQRIKENA